MYIYFTKMQGLGNDFAVIDHVRYHTEITPDMVRRMADRHFGIGFDQLLLVEPPEQPELDFNYRIFNHDGSEVEQCGNGARCFMRFIQQQGLTNKHCVKVKTSAGIISMESNADRPELITVNMGAPCFTLSEVPFIPTPDQSTIAPCPVKVAEEWIHIYPVSMGNPHAVILQQDSAIPVDLVRLERLGQAINQHTQFPAGVNLSVMQRISKTAIDLHVYERGAGQTLACGTAACAAVAAGQHYGLLETSGNQDVQVHLPGGALYIAQNEQGDMMLRGPAEEVFTGRIWLNTH